MSKLQIMHGHWLCEGRNYEVVFGEAEVTLVHGLPPITVPALQFLEDSGPGLKTQHGVYAQMPLDPAGVYTPVSNCGCHDWPDAIHISEIILPN
jgi:hypothetical protein